MNPFLVFGDSITFGDELADVPYEEAKNDPSEHAWPALLGATNFSYPGLSNFGIRRLCINFSTYRRPNFIIIAWSYNDRMEFLQAENITDYSPYTKDTKECDKLFTTVGPWPEKTRKEGQQFIDLYYKYFYSDYAGIYNTLSNIYFTQLHLESLHINYNMTFPSYKSLCVDDEYIFNLFVDKSPIDAVIGNIKQLYELIDWTKFIFLENETSNYCGIMDFAKELNAIAPHNHPSQECHNKYADELRRRIF
jgi:hypothetical protein